MIQNKNRIYLIKNQFLKIDLCTIIPYISVGAANETLKHNSRILSISARKEIIWRAEL